MRDLRLQSLAIRVKVKTIKINLSKNFNHICHDFNYHDIIRLI